jgi:hypothetical protein
MTSFPTVCIRSGGCHVPLMKQKQMSQGVSSPPTDPRRIISTGPVVEISILHIRAEKVRYWSKRSDTAGLADGLKSSC